MGRCGLAVQAHHPAQGPSHAPCAARRWDRGKGGPGPGGGGKAVAGAHQHEKPGAQLAPAPCMAPPASPTAALGASRGQGGAHLPGAASRSLRGVTPPNGRERGTLLASDSPAGRCAVPPARCRFWGPGAVLCAPRAPGLAMRGAVDGANRCRGLPRVPRLLSARQNVPSPAPPGFPSRTAVAGRAGGLARRGVKGVPDGRPRHIPGSPSPQIAFSCPPSVPAALGPRPLPCHARGAMPGGPAWPASGQGGLHRRCWGLNTGRFVPPEALAPLLCPCYWPPAASVRRAALRALPFLGRPPLPGALAPAALIARGPWRPSLCCTTGPRPLSRPLRCARRGCTASKPPQQEADRLPPAGPGASCGWGQPAEQGCAGSWRG